MMVKNGTLTIRLRGPIAEDGPVNVAAVRAALAESPGHDRLLVDIGTDGGDVNVALEINETIRAQPLSTAAITEKCHSAGLIIFLAAGLRIAKPNATFLLHPLTVSRDDLWPSMTIKALRDEARKLELKHNRNINLIADRTGFDRAWLCNEAETEEFMSAAVANHCGLIHAIAGAKGPCDPDWPETAKRIIAEERHVILPQHLTSANFFEACRISAGFPEILG